jgi:MOSC domain-containing protein YiiM
MAKIVSLNISISKGMEKKPVDEVTLRVDHGIVGDAHARNWHRQISLLAVESVNKMLAENPDLDLPPGAFAENITTEGIDLISLPIGTRLVSGQVELEVTQIGKKCHDKCNIAKKVGTCIMPKEGIFVKVIAPGILRPGEELILKK